VIVDISAGSVRIGYVTVSPDGTRIAFNGQDQDRLRGLFVVDVDGGGLAQFCEDLDCNAPRAPTS
jgi:Tol biopolymer transport system component